MVIAECRVLLWAVVAGVALAGGDPVQAGGSPSGESVPVIAAPPVGDQLPADSPVVTGNAFQFTAFDVGLLVAAALSILIIITWRLWRLPADPNRPQAFSTSVGLVLYVAQTLAALLGAQIAIAFFLPGEKPDLPGVKYTFEQQVTAQAGSYALQLVVVGMYMAMVLRATRSPFVKRLCLWRAGLLGAGALLLIWPLSQAVGTGAAIVQSALTGEQIQQLAHDTLRQMVERPVDAWTITQAALVIAIAPLLEEVLYRGVFQETLRRLGLGAWPAIIFTSVFFAIMHWTIAEVHAVISLAVLSVGFGWAYEKTGRLTASIIMHVLFNAGNFALAMLLHPTATAALLP